MFDDNRDKCHLGIMSSQLNEDEEKQNTWLVGNLLMHGHYYFFDGTFKKELGDKPHLKVGIGLKNSEDMITPKYKSQLARGIDGFHKFEDVRYHTLTYVIIGVCVFFVISFLICCCTCCLHSNR